MGAWLVAAGLNGLMAVAMGAFAAHGLRASLDPAALGWIETASRYQLLPRWRCSPLGGLALIGGWAALVVLGVLRWRAPVEG